MALPRFHNLPPERRVAVLEAAARHFAADGYDGASVNRILADCGVSKGAAYYWFHDKADLFCTTVEHAASAVLGPAPLDIEGLDAEGFWPAIASLYAAQIRGYREAPHLWRVTKAAAAATAHPSDGERIAERLAPLAAPLRALLARALEVGALRSDLPVPLVVAMIGGLDDAIDQWLLDNPTEPADDDLIATLFATLRAVASGVRS